MKVIVPTSLDYETINYETMADPKLNTYPENENNEIVICRTVRSEEIRFEVNKLGTQAFLGSSETSLTIPLSFSRIKNTDQLKAVLKVHFLQIPSVEKGLIFHVRGLGGCQVNSAKIDSSFHCLNSTERKRYHLFISHLNGNATGTEMSPQEACLALGLSRTIYHVEQFEEIRLGDHYLIYSVRGNSCTFLGLREYDNDILPTINFQSVRTTGGVYSTVETEDTIYELYVEITELPVPHRPSARPPDEDMRAFMTLSGRLTPGCWVGQLGTIVGETNPNVSRGQRNWWRMDRQAHSDTEWCVHYQVGTYSWSCVMIAQEIANVFNPILLLRAFRHGLTSSYLSGQQVRIFSTARERKKPRPPQPPYNPRRPYPINVCGVNAKRIGTCSAVLEGVAGCGFVAQKIGGRAVGVDGVRLCGAVGCGAVAGAAAADGAGAFGAGAHGAQACGAVACGAVACGAHASGAGANGAKASGAAACLEARGIGACGAHIGFCAVVACVASPLGGNW